MEIGLGVPREPIRLVRRQGRTRLVQPATGRGLTRKMNAFSRRFLSSLPAADGFILKRRSPSCGIRDTPVYDSISASRRTTRGAGLFAAAVRQRLPHVPMADENQLRGRFVRRVLDLSQGGVMISRRKNRK